MKERGPGNKSRRRFDYERRLLPNSYLEVIEPASVTENRDIGPGTPNTIGYPAWGLLYYSLYCTIDPEWEDIVVVETGTNFGYSTIVMAQALKDVGANAVVETVELDEETLEIARGHVERAGLTDYVRFHRLSAYRFLRYLVERVDHIDFIMLDDDHSREHVIKEFELIHPLLVASRGTAYFDNAGRGDVLLALRELRQRFGGNVVHFGNCSWNPPGNAIWQP